MSTPRRDQEPKPAPPFGTPPPNRRSFLLRCWREQDETRQGRTVWRFSVRAVSDEPKEYAFRSLGQLIDFLISELFASQLDEE